MPTPVKTVEEFVAAFIAAWPERDATKLTAFFSEDAVYHNGPMEPVKGRESIQATLAAFMSMGGRVGVDLVHVVALGAIVMTERVDHFIRAERTISLPVMGTFEVSDGAITAWRDYFDLNQFSSQMRDEV
jgi:limonene-1,2-epoxide hydrolase